MKKNLAQLHKDFMQECEFVAKLRPETLRGYQASFDLLQKLMPNLTCDMIYPKIMTLFFEKMDKRKRIVGRGQIKTGVKNSTVATYRSKLNKFFDWLKRNGHLKENPFREMEYPSVNYEDKKFMEQEKVEKVFIAITYNINWKDNLVKKRNIAIFSILLFCGIRKGELLGLKMLDIDIDRKLLTVRAEISKSKKTRKIPLHSKLVNILKDYFEERKKLKYETPYLFVSSVKDNKLTAHGLKHLVKKIVSESGTKFNLHLFRHTFAVNYLNISNSNIAKLSQLMGHKNIIQTMTYLRCIPTQVMRADIEAIDIENLI